KNSWVRNFRREIQKQIKATEAAARTNLAALNRPTDDAGPSPGRASMSRAKAYMEGAGQRWKLAFFLGMEYVLGKIIEAYKTLDGQSNLKKIANVVKEVGKEWQTSAERTKVYISKFTKWASAEL